MDRDALADWYRSVRDLTERLAAPLSAEDQTVQSMPDVSPTKWHRAHVTWFFETFVLGEHAPGYQPVDEAYGYLFNSYYEAVGPRHPRPQRGLVTRPGVAEVGAYRAEVDARMADFLAEIDGGTLEKVGGLVQLGLHHEQQHQELLLMDIEHVLSTNPTRPAYLASSTQPGGPGPASEAPAWVEFEGGLVEVGAPAHGGFHFDNEGPRHRVWLEPFRLCDRLVTSGEWKAFIDDGGYVRPELWLSDGWHLVNAEGWDAPLYWQREPSGEWWHHTLMGTVAVRDAEPVCHVSFYEADAYATWAGNRLPTEFEWEHAAASAPIPARADEIRLHPKPATKGSGLGQLHDDCWQWTASAYRPYPGFEPAAGAIGEYNGKFMSNQMVLRGSCAYTPRGHARTSYRNFFPPHARWMLSGLRLADGGNP